MNRSTMIALPLVCTLAAGFSPAAGGESGGGEIDWANWRGPEMTGMAPGAEPPVVFSPTENVKWIVDVPGEGHSSPIVLGDRVYLMTAVDTGQPIAVILVVMAMYLALSLITSVLMNIYNRRVQIQQR